MGFLQSKPDHNLLVKQYIATLPTLPAELKSGDDVYNYFRQQREFYEISAFNDPRFKARFRQLATTASEAEELNLRFAQINKLSQNLFDQKHSSTPATSA